LPQPPSIRESFGVLIAIGTAKPPLALMAAPMVHSALWRGTNSVWISNDIFCR
jgi:hypothetical protein